MPETSGASYGGGVGDGSVRIGVGVGGKLIEGCDGVVGDVFAMADAGPGEVTVYKSSMSKRAGNHSM